jgi:hypothetical protein
MASDVTLISKESSRNLQGFQASYPAYQALSRRPAITLECFGPTERSRKRSAGPTPVATEQKGSESKPLDLG